jgi:CheY-like chemotaxis protein
LVAESANGRTSAAQALEELGYSVDQVATGSEALGRARAAQGRYDAVLLLDDELPDKTGEALAVEMRANFADLPILVASAERMGPSRRVLLRTAASPSSASSMTPRNFSPR